jgi:gas vesicle protein
MKRFLIGFAIGVAIGAAAVAVGTARFGGVEALAVRVRGAITAGRQAMEAHEQDMWADVRRRRAAGVASTDQNPSDPLRALYER